MKDNQIRGLDKFEPDVTLQKENSLSELESFILKPYLDKGSLLDFSKKDIERYLRIEEKDLEEVDPKTIRVCIATKEFIREHYDEILKQIEEKEDLENEGR